MTENKRIIKFRGRRVDNGEWVYGAGIVIVGDDYAAVPVTKDVTSRDYQITLCKVVPETVGEFAGLLDKNGKEIYEGDIVKITTTGLAWGKEYDWVGEVIFSRAAFVVKSKDGKKDKFTMFAPDRPIEVVGSKFENPELIKS